MTTPDPLTLQAALQVVLDAAYECVEIIDITRGDDDNPEDKAHMDEIGEAIHFVEDHMKAVWG